MLFRFCFAVVFEMISWKNSFKKISEEYALTLKKKEALEQLLKTGRISQSTYDDFSKEIDATLEALENQKKALMEKMKAKVNELETQIKTLEVFLVNLEIQRVTGEVDETAYENQAKSLTAGIEAAKQELSSMLNAMDELSLKAEPVEVKEVLKPFESSSVAYEEPAEEPKGETEEESAEQFPSVEPEPAVESSTVEEVESEEKVEFEPLESEVSPAAEEDTESELETTREEEEVLL